MNAPHYLITGAGGFIGGTLAMRLHAAGMKVTGVVRGAPPAALAQRGVPFLRTTLEDLARETAVLAEVTHVVHVAGDPRFGNGPHYRASNVEATDAVVRAARAAPNLQRFVFVSTIGAVDRAADDPCSTPLDEASPLHPTSDYGRSKREAEALVQASGLPFAILRPCMVVGAAMRANSHLAVFTATALRGGLLARLDLPGTLSTIHVDDLAAALQCVAEHPEAEGRVFFAAGSPVRLGDLFAWAAPHTRRLPLAPLAALSRPVIRWLPFAAKVLLYPALVADDGALRRLGWQPLHTDRAMLEAVIERERRRVNPDMPPEGRSVVTGAASGLGRATALALHARGRRLLLVDHDAEGLALVLPDSSAVQRFACDLSDEAAIAALVGSPAWQAEAIDELYACAGFGLRGAASDIDGGRQTAMLRVIVGARLLLAQSLIPQMRTRGFGRIVWISSSSAFQPLPQMAMYAAANAALLSLGEAMAHELRGSGVDVHVVCPGGMQTPFQARAGVKEVEGEKLMTPEAVAAAILDGIAKRKTVILVSFRSLAMSLLARLLPRALSVALWGRLMAKMR